MEHKDYRLAAIMFTDIVGFSRMMEQDEAGTIALLGFHDALIRKHTAEHKGTVIKTIGDAFLVDFTNTVNAVKCAVALQNDLCQYNKDHPEKKLVLRIGIHLGDIYFYETDALGEGINIASRLQSLCNPGRICISQDVHNLSFGKVEIPGIREMGEVKLKNISREIRAYEILTQGCGDEETPKPSAASAEASSNRQPSAEDSADPGTRFTRGGSESGGGPAASGASAGQSSDRQPGPAVTGQGTIDVHELKNLVLAEIKRLGRRISVDRVRSWYPGTPPGGLEDALEALAERGYISRGPASASPGNGRGYRNTGVRSDAARGNRERRELKLKFESEEPYSDNFREIKEVTREIGREIRKAFRDPDSWFRSSSQTEDVLKLPARRADGSNDMIDKRVERQWDRALEMQPSTLEEEQLIIQEYRRQTGKSVQKYDRGLRGHAGAYFGVNVFLFSMWAFVAGAGFPWFLIPALAWGIGMFSHIGSVRRRRRELAEVNALPGLTRNQLRTLRRLHKNREKWGGHWIATGATSLFLFVLNMITSPFVPWSLIPIGAMSIGIFAHFPSFQSKQNQLLEDLRRQGVPTEVLVSTKQRKRLSHAMAELPDDASPNEREAARLRTVILAQLATFGDEHPLGEDFPPLLDDYVKQISELSRRVKEIKAIIQEIPRVPLERDLLTLEHQMNQTTNPALKAEYQKSIDQIKRQQTAFEELDAQEKIISLKTANAMNSLRQIQLELARMKSFGKKTGDVQLDELKDRTHQLNTYVDALRSGYQDLGSDDFAELEKYRDL